MGAEVFYSTSKAKKPNEAFKECKEDAYWEHGHGGYTGTIAEKSGYSMSRKPKEIPANTWIDMVEDFDEEDTDQEHYSALKHDFNIYDDKWGDALCIEAKEGFIFCGWASS
jgi:hypothetical protein